MVAGVKRLLMIGLLVSIAMGCSDGDPKTGAEAEAEAEESAVRRSFEYVLPVSLNEVMVALVNQAADPIWVAEWQAPATDEQWRALERNAYQLELAGSLIAFPGTGALDRKWVAKPAWQKWANQLRDVGEQAVVAVQARDLDSIADIGDLTVEICEGCHRDYKLEFPTSGKFGELSPLPSDK